MTVSPQPSYGTPLHDAGLTRDECAKAEEVCLDSRVGHCPQLSKAACMASCAQALGPASDGGAFDEDCWACLMNRQAQCIAAADAKRASEPLEERRTREAACLLYMRCARQ